MSKWKQFCKNFKDAVKLVGMRQIATIASATAFWFFVSLVPIVILVVYTLPFINASQSEMTEAFLLVFPSTFEHLIESILSEVYENNVAVFSISAFATIWTAGVGFASLFRGLEEIYGIPLEKRASFMNRRLKGIVFTVVMLVAILFCMLAMGFGDAIVDFLSKYIPQIRFVLENILRLRFVIVLAVLTLFFVFVFRYATRVHPRFLRILPGALLSALVWVGLSQGISIWVEAFGGYSAYGSLATFVVVMLWLYYCQYIFLLAACLNRALAGTFPKKEKDTVK